MEGGELKQERGVRVIESSAAFKGPQGEEEKEKERGGTQQSQLCVG